MAIFGKTQPMQEMSDAERLAQIMQGNLAGQLNTGDKLSALGALLKSVSRGSTTTPQQVIQGLQQQKLQEVQGRLQLDQLRKQAEQQAQLNALKAEYIANAPDAQTARELQLMTPEDFSAFLRERRKPQGPMRLAFDQGVARNPYTGAVINPKALALNLPTIYGDDDPNYDQLPSGAQYVDAEGFIKLNALRLKILGKKNKE